MDDFNSSSSIFPFSNQGFLNHHHHHHQITSLPMSFHHDQFPARSNTVPPFHNSMLNHPLPSSQVGNCFNTFDMISPEIEFHATSDSDPCVYATTGKANKKNQVQKRKREGNKEREELREVVHVRAKRGQATDSHSLAERLRREKINEKLRCLQDLVPGCYKTMGMAVMLDVIINYVRSLQNQIDFLSMKLSAASLFYDFNSSEAEEAIDTIQESTGEGMEKLEEGCYGGISHFQTPNWSTLHFN